MLLTSSSEKRNDAVIEFKLPELGENIEQGDLVRLMVAPGASVSAGQSVMELETDKAVVEVPSSVTGTIQEIKVKEGDKIKVGQVIFTVDGAEAKASPQPAAQAAAAAPTPAPAPVQQKPVSVPPPPAPPAVAPALRRRETPRRAPRPRPLRRRRPPRLRPFNKTQSPCRHPRFLRPSLPPCQSRQPLLAPANSNSPNSEKTDRKAISFA